MISRNLHLRIVFLFVVAILPAACLAIFSAISSYNEARGEKDVALMRSAQLVAAREGALIESIRRVLITLSSQDAVQGASVPQCTNALNAAVDANPAYSALAIRSRDQGVVCETTRGAPVLETAREDGAGLDRLARQAAGDTRFALAAITIGDRQTVAAATPIQGRPGLTLILFVAPGFLGSANLTAPSLPAASAGLLTDALDPLSLYFFSDDVEWLPAQEPFTAASQSFSSMVTGPSRNGTAYRYAAVPIPQTDIFVLSGSPVDRLYQSERLQLWSSIAFPLALLLLSVATAWIAVDRLVLRWVSELREAAASYGAGNFGTRARTPRAMPNELRVLADTFNTMAQSVSERSEQLEHAVEAKSQLLRELHHRVKNNFQVIASLLALQKRSLGENDRAVLRYSEDRVQAMATAYRVSYASGEIGNVGVGELLQELTTYLRQSANAPAHFLRIELNVGDAEVDLDTAIPLSLLFTEVTTPIADEARRTGRTAYVEAMIDASGDLVVLATGPAFAEAEARQNHELSAKLARAFVQQVEGRLESERGDPQVWRIVIPASRIQTPSKAAAAEREAALDTAPG